MIYHTRKKYGRLQFVFDHRLYKVKRTCLGQLADLGLAAKLSDARAVARIRYREAIRKAEKTGDTWRGGASEEEVLDHVINEVLAKYAECIDNDV